MKRKCIAAHVGCIACTVGALQSLCVWVNGSFHQGDLLFTLLLGVLAITLARAANNTARRMQLNRLQILQEAQTKIAGHNSNCDRLEPRRVAN